MVYRFSQMLPYLALDQAPPTALLGQIKRKNTAHECAKPLIFTAF